MLPKAKNWLEYNTKRQIRLIVSKPLVRTVCIFFDNEYSLYSNKNDNVQCIKNSNNNKNNINNNKFVTKIGSLETRASAINCVNRMQEKKKEF